MKSLRKTMRNLKSSNKGIGLFGIAAIATIIALIVGVVLGAVYFSVDTGVVRDLDHMSAGSRSANVQNPIIVNNNALSWDIKLDFNY